MTFFITQLSNCASYFGGECSTDCIITYCINVRNLGARGGWHITFWNGSCCMHLHLRLDLIVCVLLLEHLHVCANLLNTYASDTDTYTFMFHCPYNFVCAWRSSYCLVVYAWVSYWTRSGSAYLPLSIIQLSIVQLLILPTI